MASYSWNGQGFSGIQLTTQFVLDPNNNLYLFEQNVSGLYPCSVDGNGNPQYNGDAQFAIAFIPAGTIFNQTNAYNENQISNVMATIYTGQLSIFQSNPSNIIGLSTQQPSSYVDSDISTALASAGLGDAFSTAAPYLTSPELNFGLQSIPNTWQNGQGTLNDFSNALNNHQANLVNANNAVQRITDFKKKILRQHAVFANEISKVQNSTNTYLASGTFTHLAAAFPSHFGPLLGTLQNHNSLASTQLANALPKIAYSAGSPVEGTVNGVVNNLFGSNPENIPNIVSPIDKFVTDINTLPTSNNTIVNQISNSGFSSLKSQMSYVNQVVNILSNLKSKIPVTNTVPLPTPVTNPQAINEVLTNYSNAQLNLNNNAAPSSAQVQTNQLASLMEITGPSYVNESNPTTPSYVPTNPVYGGSLINLPSMQNIFNGEVDESVVVPSVTLSPDPSVQSQQISASIAQNKANQLAVNNTPVQGVGINTLDEVPLRPRNTPVDGSLGDYNISVGLQP